MYTPKKQPKKCNTGADTMSCNNPFYLPHKDYKGHTIKGIFDQIPCGWCMGCKIDKRNMWEDRINWARNGMSSAFVTFTYDEQHLPTNREGMATLRRDDFTHFIFRVRKTIERKNTSKLNTTKFKYYAVGEYGDAFGRPHKNIIMRFLSGLISLIREKFSRNAGKED